MAEAMRGGGNSSFVPLGFVRDSAPDGLTLGITGAEVTNQIATSLQNETVEVVRRRLIRNSAVKADRIGR